MKLGRTKFSLLQIINLIYLPFYLQFGEKWDSRILLLPLFYFIFIFILFYFNLFYYFSFPSFFPHTYQTTISFCFSRNIFHFSFLSLFSSVKHKIKLKEIMIKSDTNYLLNSIRSCIWFYICLYMYVEILNCLSLSNLFNCEYFIVEVAQHLLGPVQRFKRSLYKNWFFFSFKCTYIFFFWNLQLKRRRIGIIKFLLHNIVCRFWTKRKKKTHKRKTHKWN